MSDSPGFLIIGGTYKSGTTSLFTYLNQTNEIQGSRIKETAFFVPARYNGSVENKSAYLKKFFTPLNDQVHFLLEASPGYLYGGKKIARSIKETLGQDVKVIFILREPVSRFVSFYRMLANENAQNTIDIVSTERWSLEDYYSHCKEYQPSDPVDEELDFILQGLNDGCYASYLKEWYDEFPEGSIRVCFFDDLEADPQKVCEGIATWLNIPGEQFAEMEFRKVNPFRSHKSKALQRVASFINHRLEFIWRRNEKLKAKLTRMYDKINTRKSSTSDRPAVITEIENYYRANNEELADLLSQKGYSYLPDWLKVR